MRHRDQFTPAVRAAITETERQSEILISVFQLAFVIFIGVLYFLAPKGYEGTVPVRPVPLVLLGYSPFVIARLVLAWKRALPPALLTLSVVLDIGMICVLLWTYHIQYEQPAGFYLKAPTAMYLFIFVALRGLRFDPRYVLFAGGTAAAGWLVLTLLAISGESEITGDFISYITGTDVLVGAQVDRIIALLTFTAILAVGVSRSGKILATSASETHARLELSRYFSPDVTERILDSETGFQPGQGEVSTAVVVTVDLRGFSAWAQRVEPTEVMETLAEYQGRIVPVILHHGGSIDKFMGDGVLCHFGAATPTEHAHADALRCAEALRDTLIEWTTAHHFEFGIGIAGGRLIFGAVGDSDRLEFTVIGSPVNTAAKLEKHTKEVGAHILIPYEDLRQASEEGYRPYVGFKRLRERRVEGISDPMDLAVVLRE